MVAIRNKRLPTLSWSLQQAVSRTYFAAPPPPPAATACCHRLLAPFLWPAAETASPLMYAATALHPHAAFKGDTFMLAAAQREIRSKFEVRPRHSDRQGACSPRLWLAACVDH